MAIKNDENIMVNALYALFIKLYSRSFITVIEFHVRRKTGKEFSTLLTEEPEELYKALASFFENEHLIKSICESIVRYAYGASTQVSGDRFLHALKSGDKKAIKEILVNLAHRIKVK